MKPKANFFACVFVGITLALLLLSVFSTTVSAAEKATECKTEGCHVTITLKLAFVGASDRYIVNFIDEVEREWNGPEDNPNTYGDCKCPFNVDVIAQKVDKCTSAPNGYHCVEVTNYSTKPPYSANESVIGKVQKGEIDPKTSDQVKRHRGYMKPPGVSTGEPLTGWWSDIMSTSVNGQQALDFAHEAGHMMGLDDGEGGIMNLSGVMGPNAGVTQDNINKVVERVCGANACPDRCCCGNAQVDGDKGESCDPLASPCGCKNGEACCPICCNCYAPDCDPAYGEYGTKANCEQNCTDEGMVCQKNYHTGCWDCIESWAVGACDEYDNSTEGIWKANESHFHEKHQMKAAIEEALAKLTTVPIISSLFANERINVNLEDAEYSLVTCDGAIIDVGAGTREEPTVEVFSDMETIERIVTGDLGVEEALEEGDIRYEGVGFLTSVKFGVVDTIYDIYSLFSS
jgi:hypothetical protein